ncbi:hypothetical protein BJ944DRAFT_269072 [Cunninghamella echinulata]|nr:hypothetical protein BJ944DRAFT_269072 [Cunninghamella echinulata]
MKYSILLLALCFAVYVQAKKYYALWYRTKAGKWYYIPNDNGLRTCYCVKNINTHIMDSIEGGNVKVFRSTDCTGAYQTLKGRVKNMEWVNSVSIGPSGSSRGPFGCPRKHPQ